MESFRAKAAFLGGMATAVKKFAPQAGAMLSRGLGRELKTQVGFGAALGGLAEGGINAYQAEEGQKLKAFGQGAAHGAVTGGVMGGLTAPISTAGKNLRRQAMTGMGYSPMQAGRALKDGYRTTLKNVAGFGKANRSRGAAAFEAVAAPAQLAAEFAVPAAAMGMLAQPLGGAPAPAEAPPPQQPPLRPAQLPAVKQASEPVPIPAPEAPVAGGNGGFKFEPVYIAPFTGTTGAGLTDAAIDRFHPNMREGFLRKRLLPSLGAAALTIPVVKGIRAMYPEKEPLEEIDVDALKQYFGKQPG